MDFTRCVDNVELRRVRVDDVEAFHWRTVASSWKQQDIRYTVLCTGDTEYRKIRLLGGYFSAIKFVIIRSVLARARPVVLSVHFVRSIKWWDKTPFYFLFSELHHMDHDGLVWVPSLQYRKVGSETDSSMRDVYANWLLLVVDKISIAGHLDFYNIDKFLNKVHEYPSLPMVQRMSSSQVYTWFCFSRSYVFLQTWPSLFITTSGRP